MMTLMRCTGWKALVFVGLAMVAIGFAGIFAQIVFGDRLSDDAFMIVNVGDSVLTTLGCFGFLIGCAFQSLEKRMDRLENR